MSDEQNTETTTQADELVELAAPPAPPTAHEPPTSGLEGEAPADEDGAGTSAPAPSSPDSEEDETPPASPDTTEGIRDRIRTLEERRHDSSPGFGVSGKFEGARADRATQVDE